MTFVQFSMDFFLKKQNCGILVSISLITFRIKVKEIIKPLGKLENIQMLKHNIKRRAVKISKNVT